MLSGIPQGSILDPYYVFLIYINDIFRINIHSSYLLLQTSPSVLDLFSANSFDEQRLQHDIDLLLGWSYRSFLCFNPTNVCILRHTAVCRAAKKVARNTRVLFTRTKILPISTSRILKTAKQNSTKLTYFMLYISLTLHTKFDVGCASGS